MSAQIILSEPKLYPAMNQQDDVMIIDCGKISDKFEKIILKTTTEAIEKTEIVDVSQFFCFLFGLLNFDRHFKVEYRTIQL